jgi:hypothetical protein
MPTVLRSLCCGSAVLAACALLCLAEKPACGLSGRQAVAPQIALRRDGSRLIVSNSFYEAVVSPQQGGRIVSFKLGNVEMTRLLAGGHGGLFEEVHSADFAFRPVENTAGEGEVSLGLSAEAGDLAITKEYRFRADRPWFEVRLTFENRSRSSLAGADAPALRHLVVPDSGSGPPLYCLDRGEGAEALSADAFVARLYARPTGALRWMAVADPAARRSLGFALPEGGCRPLRPLRPPAAAAAEADRLVIGWAYPAIPPASILTARVLVAPLDGFAAVSELNERFAAESLPVPSAEPPRVELGLMPLAGAMGEVSVITRVYDAAGKELVPCDPLVVRDLPAGRAYSGSVVWQARPGRPDWLVHEVYAAGQRAGSFAVPVGAPTSPAPVAAAASLPPETRRLGTASAELAGASAPDAAARERGFVLWRYDGPPARRELGRVEVALAAGERRTLFLGVHALRPLASLRFLLAGAEPARAGWKPIPPTGAYLWQLKADSPEGTAYLAPLVELTLDAGRTAWLAMTADASQMASGDYEGRLVASSDGTVWQVPLEVHVLPVPAPSAGAFGLWFVPEGTDAPMAEASLSRLADYGVTALTLPMPAGGPAEAAVLAGRAAPTGLTLLSLMGAGGALAPPGGSTGLLPFAFPQPVWLMDLGAAPVGALRGAAAGGYAAAFICERLADLDAQGGAGRPAARFCLVRDGCEPGRVREMVASGSMDGSCSVWLLLDLRDCDWRRAALEVRRAFWAAAWQGLAGAAVRCRPPRREVDRQSPLWHVLRDARSEAALWRTAQASTAGPARDAVLSGILGPGPGPILPVVGERRPFGSVYRVGAGVGEAEVSLEQFEQARARLLRLLAEPAPEASGRGDQVYWGDVPLLAEGRAVWAICTRDGEVARKRAVALQKGIEQLAARSLPISREFPSARLVWLVTEEGDGPDLPGAVRAAVAQVGGPRFQAVVLEDGTVVAVLKGDFDVAALVRSFRRERELFPPAGAVR